MNTSGAILKGEMLFVGYFRIIERLGEMKESDNEAPSHTRLKKQNHFLL